jgi:hypothetical protein
VGPRPLLDPDDADPQFRADRALPRSHAMKSIKLPDAPLGAPGQLSGLSGACHREEAIEQRENHEKGDADPEAPADQMLFDRQQRLGMGFLKFLLNVDF